MLPDAKWLKNFEPEQPVAENEDKFNDNDIHCGKQGNDFKNGMSKCSMGVAYMSAALPISGKEHRQKIIAIRQF